MGDKLRKAIDGKNGAGLYKRILVTVRKTLSDLYVNNRGMESDAVETDPFRVLYRLQKGFLPARDGFPSSGMGKISKLGETGQSDRHLQIF